MNKKRFSIALLVLFCIVLALAANCIAQGIKERFKERLPEIIELKKEGIVGENINGYLEFVSDKVRKQELIEAENRDRRAVYEAIAEKENTTVEKVGKRRALQLRELASPGEWLQDDTGRWYRK